MSEEISREEFDKLIKSYATKICSEIIKNGFEGVEMLLRVAMSETLDTKLKLKRDETPIQELINRLDYLIGLSNDTLYESGLKVAKKEAEQMIKKESPKSAQRYYNETFNTKER